MKRFIVPPTAKPTDIFAQKGKGGKGAGGKEKQSTLIKHVIANAQRAGRALRKVRTRRGEKKRGEKKREDERREEERREEERREEEHPPLQCACSVHGGGAARWNMGRERRGDDGGG